MKKNIEDVRTTHQEYIRCHEQGETDLGTEHVDPSTTELDYRHRNLQQEVGRKSEVFLKFID
jgi:hypothetical protein